MMLKVICPKCRHRFPVLGCCLEQSDGTNEKNMKEKETEEDKEEEKIKEEEEEDKKEEKTATNIHSTTYYVSDLPVPRGYTSSDCFINPSKIIHKPGVYQSRAVNCGSDIEITGSDTIEFSYDIQESSVKHPLFRSPIYQSDDQDPFVAEAENINCGMASSVASTCELADDNVTITTPDIQSGGCLVQNTETEILVQASQIKIQPKLTGGGCLVQKKLSAEDEQLSKYTKDFAFVNNNIHQTFTSANGSSELPGNIRILSSGTIRDDENNEVTSTGSRQQKISSVMKTNDCCDCKNVFQQNHCRYHRRLFDASLADNRESLLLEPVGNRVQIRVNATVQLPANLGQCTVNITATTTTPPNQVVAMKLPGRGRNNFHGGGIVQPNELDCTTMNRTAATGNSKSCNNIEQRDEAPSTPVSWLMPTSWTLDVDVNRLREVKRLLQICGWYHEGISWQQSENLLKNASIGRWLMRDSSDSRYTFAISVQTARGPASIRVHYFLKQFRLDAEPRLALAMPFFDCPIRMLEHYVEYSKRMDEHRREVWVDYSGQLYSQIYLTNPLVKEVRSLSHLARLAVNRNKLSTEHLPLLIKNYIEEYPYTL